MYIVKNFNFTGYDAWWDDIMPQIESMISPYGSTEAVDEFINGLAEAVCNATMYNPDGIDGAKVYLYVIITDSSIKVTVRAKTRSFDTIKFRLKLKQLALEGGADMDWQQYVGLTQKGRGLWLMLSTFDAVCLEQDGNEITLTSRLPLRTAEVDSIGKIVHKLFISKNGVIT